MDSGVIETSQFALNQDGNHDTPTKVKNSEISPSSRHLSLDNSTIAPPHFTKNSTATFSDFQRPVTDLVATIGTDSEFAALPVTSYGMEDMASMLSPTLGSHLPMPSNDTTFQLQKITSSLTTPIVSEKVPMSPLSNCHHEFMDVESPPNLVGRTDMPTPTNSLTSHNHMESKLLKWRQHARNNQSDTFSQALTTEYSHMGRKSVSHTIELTQEIPMTVLGTEIEALSEFPDTDKLDEKNQGKMTQIKNKTENKSKKNQNNKINKEKNKKKKNNDDNNHNSKKMNFKRRNSSRTIESKHTSILTPTSIVTNETVIIENSRKKKKK